MSMVKFSYRLVLRAYIMTKNKKNRMPELPRFACYLLQACLVRFPFNTKLETKDHIVNRLRLCDMCNIQIHTQIHKL